MSGKNLKQRIRDGELIYGVSVPVSANREEMKAIIDKDHYDFVMADSQHSAYNEPQLVEYCNIADSLDIPVHFRIKHTRNAYLIGNYLDLGPSGVEVPQVELESTVDEAVTWFYYPQIGIRSAGGGSRKGIAERSDRLEYANWWNQYGVLWMQVESVSAATNARKLAKPGVDCLSFGPADLTFSIESYPHHSLKTVDDCVHHVCDQLADTEVAVCYRNGTPDTREKYAEMGVTVFLEGPRR